MNELLDGWMDGWMDRCMYVCMYGWMDGYKVNQKPLKGMSKIAYGFKGILSTIHKYKLKAGQL